MVLAAVDAVPDTLCVEAADRSHFSVYPHGVEKRPRALGVYPGYIYWLARWAQDLDPVTYPAVTVHPDASWQTLSTFRPNDAPRGSRGHEAEFCATCFQQLPATGLCDTCD